MMTGFEQKWSKQNKSKGKKGSTLVFTETKILDKEHFYVNDRSGSRLLSVCNFTRPTRKKCKFFFHKIEKLLN